MSARLKSPAGFAVILIVIAFSLITYKWLASDSNGVAAQPTPYNNVFPPGVTPGPTSTPIPAPTGAATVDATTAENSALAALEGTADRSSASAKQSRAGDLTAAGPFSHWSSDYPVWVVQVAGSFHGSFDESSDRQFASATVYVDGTSGAVLGVSLTSQITPTAVANSTPTP